MIRNSIRLLNKGIFIVSSLKQSEPLRRKIFTRHVILSNPIGYCGVQNQRFKSKSSKNTAASESQEDPSEDKTEDEVIQDKHTKVLTINVTSLRLDGILKHSLGIARNKIDQLFYENKLRLNSEKIQKKSTSIRVGDEIDLIRGPDLKNPNFTNVARVEILSIKGNEDSISVKVKRCKSLIVDDYLEPK